MGYARRKIRHMHKMQLAFAASCHMHIGITAFHCPYTHIKRKAGAMQNYDAPVKSLFSNFASK